MTTLPFSPSSSLSLIRFLLLCLYAFSPPPPPSLGLPSPLTVALSFSLPILSLFPCPLSSRRPVPHTITHQDDIKVGSSLNNLAGLLATTGNVEEALPLFKRSHEIYVEHLGENHPHSVATQLWVQQLSAPPPAARARRQRRSRDNAPLPSRDLLNPPPPLLEGGAEEEEGGSETPTSPGQQPVSF